MKDWKEIWPDRASPSGQVKRGLSTEEKTEVYVYRFNQVHDNQYTYEKTSFSTSHGPVTITCPLHGEFTQKAYSHLQGHGCKKCASEASTKSQGDFISDALRIHKGEYDYSSVKYVNSYTKVKINCHLHGPFEQEPSAHLVGNGCPTCGSRKNIKEFILSAKSVHGDKYDYSLSEYVTAHTKLTVLCKEHGPFQVLPSNHLQGGGCPICANQIFGILYLLNLSNDIFKLGITNNLDRRVKQISSGLPPEYSINIVGFWQVDNTREIEQVLLNKYTNKPKLGRKFDGYTELRVLTEQEVAEICSFLETI